MATMETITNNETVLSSDGPYFASEKPTVVFNMLLAKLLQDRDVVYIEDIAVDGSQIWKSPKLTEILLPLTQIIFPDVQTFETLKEKKAYLLIELLYEYSRVEDYFVEDLPRAFRREYDSCAKGLFQLGKFFDDLNQLLSFNLENPTCRLDEYSMLIRGQYELMEGWNEVLGRYSLETPLD